jgi:D-lactate dehydrogenase (cytochrome)
LTRLLVGSEGTLGVITEVAVRLHPLPQAISAAVGRFDSVHAAASAAAAILQLGVPVARLVFVCGLCKTSELRRQLVRTRV